MKKFLALLLTILLVMSAASSAFALNYTGRQGNEATFELLEETRISSPIAVQNLETNANKQFISLPLLDEYPLGTTYVYRSANLYGGRASARQNTNLVIFAEVAFDGKDAAFAYLKGLGVIDIVDQAIGTVVLVTPSNGTAFGAADQKYYYALQTAMFAQKASITIDGVSYSFSDAEYFGGYSFYYVIGIDGGATFLNNYVSSTLDYVSRIGGMLLVNGGMDRIREVADPVPVYLVNAPQAVIDKYEAANGTDAITIEGDKTTAYNQAFPLRKVVTQFTDTVDLAALISDAYYNLFIKAQRSQCLLRGVSTASTPYQGYSQDSTPYSLVKRNAVIDGKTVDGIHVVMHQEDRFDAVKTESGEYLQTWFEYLPDEVINGTAPAGTIPLILIVHGGGDDPRLYVEEQGFIELMGAERIAAVAPEHQYISAILPQSLPMLVKYMLATYPALDASRVYVNGYSMGGAATYSALYGDSSLFAAAVPMAIVTRAPSAEQEAQFAEIDIPIMCTTSEYDYFVDSVTHNLGMSYLSQLNQFLGYNEMDLLPAELDYDKYPISGFKADIYQKRVLNGEYTNHSWFFLKDGIPMAGVNYTEGLLHALYGEYAEVAWNFMKHFSRDVETLEISYDPYVR